MPITRKPEVLAGFLGGIVNGYMKMKGLQSDERRTMEAERRGRVSEGLQRQGLELQRQGQIQAGVDR